MKYVLLFFTLLVGTMLACSTQATVANVVSQPTRLEAKTQETKACEVSVSVILNEPPTRFDKANIDISIGNESKNIEVGNTTFIGEYKVTFFEGGEFQEDFITIQCPAS